MQYQRMFNADGKTPSGLGLGYLHLSWTVSPPCLKSIRITKLICATLMDIIKQSNTPKGLTMNSSIPFFRDGDVNHTASTTPKWVEF